MDNAIAVGILKPAEIITLKPRIGLMGVVIMDIIFSFPYFLYVPCMRYINSIKVMFGDTQHPAQPEIQGTPGISRYIFSNFWKQGVLFDIID